MMATGITLFILQACQTKIPTPQTSTSLTWETLITQGQPTPRHEAALVSYKQKLILLGGRRINPVDVYDPTANSWSARAKTPIELHHFQAVVVEDAIYLIGAMTGPWPNEKPVDRVIIYYPEQDKFVFGHKIPKERRRGAAGAVYYNGKIYILGGITNGHMNGARPWLDEYDPKTGDWKKLADAPRARDHFQAAVHNNQLYAIGGRMTSHATNQSLELTVSAVDIYDFEQGAWRTLGSELGLPTARAGNMAISWKNEIFIGGGESSHQVSAHNEVESFNPLLNRWNSRPSFNAGRHGSGFAIIGDYLYTASGSGNRGGEPELRSLERLCLKPPKCGESNHTPSPRMQPDSEYQQWDTVTLDFVGPMTSETASINPFTDYRLQVEFIHPETRYTLRGFYAADGNAAETSADSGNIWRVRFTPDKPGKWLFKASLRKAKNISFVDTPTQGISIPIKHSQGSFMVIPSERQGRDFRAHGRLFAENGYFRFRDSAKYWLKGGTNSPENLLGYHDFDGTYRIVDQSREGEASVGNQLHRYAPHFKDWLPGDPVWQGNKGKSLIGAINYLADSGMNAAYFLTLNILGDGKDVWPYNNHEDFSRFDCSKLEQWEIVFQHMQNKGILLHLVTQETENELLLDAGDTGPQRQLYYRELIARFGHHLGLVWNLGEENGPAEFTPNAQNTQQRKAMAQFIKINDPYQHAILLHTHSSAHHKDEILEPLLGFQPLDGLSFQVDKRERVYQELAQWRKRAKLANRDWLITMDEIGMWHTGALPDSVDPSHNSLRRFALWGSLMAGGAGVEWYFGAKHPHNDLTAEDWRSRDKVWQMTKIALDFFNDNLPYWQMRATPELIDLDAGFSLSQPGEIYAIYLPNANTTTLDLRNHRGKFQVSWYDPLKGGTLVQSNVSVINGGGKRSLGSPPANQPQDWVALVSRSID